MRNGVVPAGGRDGPGLAHGELGIEDGQTKRRLRIAARHLAMRPCVGDQRIGLHFAPGACGGRHGNHGKHRLAGLAVAAVVGHRAAVGQQEIDTLGAVERAAAAPGDERVDTQLRRMQPSDLDHVRIGIAVEIVEHAGRHPRRVERRERSSHLTRRDEALVGDDERSPESHLARQRAELTRRAGTEHEPRPRLKVERHRAAREARRAADCPEMRVGADEHLSLRNGRARHRPLAERIRRHNFEDGPGRHHRHVPVFVDDIDVALDGHRARIIIAACRQPFLKGQLAGACVETGQDPAALHRIEIVADDERRGNVGGRTVVAPGHMRARDVAASSRPDGERGIAARPVRHDEEQPVGRHRRRRDPGRQPINPPDLAAVRGIVRHHPFVAAHHNLLLALRVPDHGR